MSSVEFCRNMSSNVELCRISSYFVELCRIMSNFVDSCRILSKIVVHSRGGGSLTSPVKQMCFLSDILTSERQMHLTCSCSRRLFAQTVTFYGTPSKNASKGG